MTIDFGVIFGSLNLAELFKIWKADLAVFE